jgi:hypothetical protein
MYLRTEYAADQQEIRDIDERLREILPVFHAFCKDGLWPYTLDRLNTPVPTQSTSTRAMILFMLKAALKEIKFSAIFPVANKAGVPDLDKLREETQADLKKDVRSSFDRLWRDTLRDGKVKSGSFGTNDVFTLTWLVELAMNHSESGPSGGASSAGTAAAAPARGTYTEFRTTLHDLAYGRFNTLMKTAIEGKPILDYAGKAKNERERLVHSFPLVRLMNLWSALKLESHGANTYVNVDPLVDQFRIRLHQQISYSTIEHSDFDPAELVFSLEGIVIGDPRALESEAIDRVFAVIRDNQRKNPYWRPLRPFVSTPQGFGLLPVSVEIANSLLRVCDHLDREVSGKSYFSENRDLFKGYASWVRSRIVRSETPEPDRRPFVGWHSEHVIDRQKIHLWETSQVMLFLMNYAGMVQRHMARQALGSVSLFPCKLDLKCKKSSVGKGSAYWKLCWEINEPCGPVNGRRHGYEIYRRIREDFLESREDGEKVKSYSMLLSGPPGTGKTSAGEELARALDWRYLAITPSDFIAEGEGEVEERAKLIFQALSEQTELVILFDEIDRLILDRDSLFYQQQSDMFQFMTPGMLPKIKTLREKKATIFIVATNFADRIDSAIKRRGRIDKQYVVLPPDTQQREKIVSGILKRRGEKQKRKYELKPHDLREISKRTVFATYGELEQMVDDAVLNKPKPEQLAAAFDPRPNPAIRLANYRSRFKSTWKENQQPFPSAQQPFEEFLLLTYVYFESGNRLTGETEDRTVLREVMNALAPWPGADKGHPPVESWFGKTARPAIEKILREPGSADIVDIVNIGLMQSLRP